MVARVFALWISLAFCRGETLSDVAILSDFEPPAFTAGSTFTGVDLWSNPVGSGTANITPDGGGTGATKVLDGTQSAVLGLSGRFGVARGWGAAGAVIGLDPWVLRGVMSQLTAGGQTEFWMSSTAGVGGASTPAGVVFHSGGTFHVVDLVLGEIETGVSWIPGDVYLVDLVIDLAADTYGVVVENLTAGTGRQNLGAGLQMADFGGSVAGSGGVILVNDGSGGTSVFDSILTAGYRSEPVAVASSAIEVDDVVILSFTTVLGNIYRLQSTASLVSGEWTDSPYVVEGTGAEMPAFDQHGGNPGKYYRIAAIQPVWLSQRVGIEALEPDWVPDPWTPVTVNGDEVTVWGRRYTFGAGSLIAGIESQDRALLAEGVNIHYMLGGQEYIVDLAAPVFSLIGQGRARVQQTGTSPHFTLHAQHTIEFDGMVRIDLSIEPLQALRVDLLWIEIPYQRFPYSMLVATGKYWQRGLVSEALFATPRVFSQIWLGDDDIGCVFFTENYRGWVVNSTQPRIALDPDPLNRRLQLLVVNEPSDIEQPLNLTFGLHPTPYKPYYAGWRDYRPQGSGMEPPPVSSSFTHSSLWNSADSKPSPRNWQVLEDAVAFARERNQTIYPYIGLLNISPYDYIRRDWPFDRTQQTVPEAYWLRDVEEATRQEDYFSFGQSWKIQPPMISHEGGLETRELVRVSAGTSYVDYFVHGITEMLKRTDVDGFYLDIANPNLNFDPARDLAVLTKDGAEEGTFEFFALRNMYKRLRYVFESERGPGRRPWMLGHGFASSAPYAPFWDITFNGEEVGPDSAFGFTAMNLQKFLEGQPLAQLQGGAGVRNYEAFSFRAHFGRQFGIPNILLPQYGRYPELKTDEHSREMLTWSFLHNCMLWPAYIPSTPVYDFWSQVEILYGMGDAVFHPYWGNAVGTEPAGIVASYWEKPGQNDYLLAVANWTSEDVEAQLALPGEFHAFQEAVDMESGELVSCGQTLDATIPAYDLRALRFQ
jgi:hypothetical protein